MADIINFYDALGIDRSEPTANIRDRLERIEVGQATRAERDDAGGQRARDMLQLVRQAEPWFRDDAAREDYDRSLRAAPAADKPAKTDWLSRAWSYYFQRDFGAAEIAARKAREDDRDNPDTYVVSAWIELAPLTSHPLLSAESWDEVLRRYQSSNRAAAHDPRSALAALAEAAKQYADEAYAIDDGSGAGDVLHVRGFCFYLLRDFPRAVQSYKSAATVTTDAVERAELALRTALAFEGQGQSDSIPAECEKALGGVDLPAGLRQALEWVWSRGTVARCEAVPVESRKAAYDQAADAIAPGVAEASRRRLTDNCRRNEQRVADYQRAGELARKKNAARDRLEKIWLVIIGRVKKIEIYNDNGGGWSNIPKVNSSYDGRSLLTLTELDQYQSELRRIQAKGNSMGYAPGGVAVAITVIFLLGAVAASSVGAFFGFGVVGGIISYALLSKGNSNASWRAKWAAACSNLAVISSMRGEFDGARRELEAVQKDLKAALGQIGDQRVASVENRSDDPAYPPPLLLERTPAA
ncbi:MAG: hypothetical protein LBK42_07050 [Propionibacteriaceae bacterium]|nr:hypothetical protein [Propionibacteriaceae bacterium]